MERCAGCGTERTNLPFVGIGTPTDEMKPYELDVKPSERGFVAYGVCYECNVDPSRRQRTLKMSFFEKSQLGTALALAGSNSIGGR